MTPAVAIQLRRRGIDAVHVVELDTAGDDDPNQLELATRLGRVLVTQDVDFTYEELVLTQHLGIVRGKQERATVGGWVRELTKLHQERDAEFMVGILLYVYPS